MNRDEKRVIIMLPAYNEEESMASLLHRVKEAMEEAALNFVVIVVDDGSTDRTAETVEEYSNQMNVILKRHKENLGLGATIRDGLYEAAKLSDPTDIIIVMDADGTHTPALIVRMTHMIAKGFDIVIASRYQPGARTIGVPFKRQVLSFMASLIFLLLFPINGVKDYTSGFRAYRAEIIKSSLAEYGERFVDQEGFQCMVDILLKLRRKHVIIGEVPLILRYDLKRGRSKMNIAHTVLNTLKLILKRKFGNI